MSSTPTRTCIICKQKTSKDKLMRWTHGEKSLVLDKDQKTQARGYYCHQGECQNSIQKVVLKGSK